MSTAQQKTLEDYIQLQNRNALAHAIRAGVELGVISELKNGQRTVEQLATTLKVYPEALRRLMDVLVSSELIEQYGEDFALSPIARLIPDRFYDLGDEHWQHLALHVRTGAPLPVCDEVPLNDVDYFTNKSSEEWTLTPTALMAAQVLDMGKSRQGTRILEIGCGSAVFGATLAHLDADSVITLVDDKIGLERAKQTIKSVELEQKTTYLECESLEQLELVEALKGQTFNLVLIAGLIHRMTSDACQRLFTKLQPLVKPGGELAIVDIFPGQDKGSLQRSIFELELGLRTSRGKLHDPHVLEENLKEAGFDQVQFAHLPAAPNYWGLILAQR